MGKEIRKWDSMTLSITEGEKAALEDIAMQFGCTWGDKPNISKLMKQIASGHLAVSVAGAPETNFITYAGVLSKLQSASAEVMKTAPADVSEADRIRAIAKLQAVVATLMSFLKTTV